MFPLFFFFDSKLFKLKKKEIRKDILGFSYCPAVLVTPQTKGEN
jgi:hypothetical protein